MIAQTTGGSPTDKSRAHGRLAVAGFPFPDELAIAVGLEPLHILEQGDARDDALEREWLDDKEESEVRTVFVAAMGGSLAGCSGLVSTRALEQAHYYLRETLRLGDWADPCPLHMFDLMPLKGDGFRQYNKGSIGRLATFLERISNRRIEDHALREAVAKTNARRTRWRNLAVRRIDGSMSGSGLFRPSQAQNPEPILDEGAPRMMLVTSRAIYDNSLHLLAESTGWRVVAEDDGTARFILASDIVLGEDPLGDLADYYASLPSALAHPRQMRTADILRRAEMGQLDAVMFCAHRTDLRLGWDYPSLQRELADRGVAATLVHGNHQSDEGAAQLRQSSLALLNAVRS